MPGDNASIGDPTAASRSPHSASLKASSVPPSKLASNDGPLGRRTRPELSWFVPIRLDAPGGNSKDKATARTCIVLLGVRRRGVNSKDMHCARLCLAKGEIGLSP